MPANNTHYRDIRVGGMPRLLTHIVIVAHIDAMQGDRQALCWLHTTGRRWLEMLGTPRALIEDYLNVAPQRQVSDAQRWDVGWGKKEAG